MESKREYERILDNPENVILSEGLKEILLDQDSFAEDTADSTDPKDKVAIQNCCLILDKEVYSFQVEKIKRIAQDIFLFEGSSVAFPIAKFLNGKAFQLKLFNTLFRLEESSPVVYKTTGNLKFTARRIIKNEEV